MKRLLFVYLLTVLPTVLFSQDLQVTNLRCENRPSPLGIDVVQPVFSWELQTTQQNVLQTAYRILVSDDSLLLTQNKGNIWDSKKVNVNHSIQVKYTGRTLQPIKKYFWKVMVWNNRNTSSAWSHPASWQMGLLNKADWKNARWIGYEEIQDTAIIAPHVHGGGKKTWGARRNVLPLLRKSFTVSKPIKKATAFICGLGHFELYINGQKTGDHFLDPGWTDYQEHAQYVTFDVTRSLQSGNNAIGVMLGNGFYYIPGQRYRKMTGAYGQPKMITRVAIEYNDGSTSDIISDASWKTAPSPIIYSSIFGGEDYDANLEQPGWHTAAFNDNAWKNVIITNGPAQLDAMLQEPLKLMEHFSVQSKNALSPAITVYDLGQNFSGIPAITVKGNKGDTVRITAAELINEDGTANQKATGSPSYCTYILKGEGTESWQPRFTYTGFRYMQVECIAKDSGKALPELTSAEGWHIRNAAPSIGSFHCSNDLFNKTYRLINWAIKSNTMSVFTDCPHREKLGWLEETHLMGSSVQYNYDIANLCRKVIRDMQHAQHENGLMPEIAPEFTVFTAPFDESPEWGSAAIILPWYLYQWYGDKTTLADAYKMMKGYIGYLKNKSTNNILSHGLGDWFDIGPDRPGVSQLTTMGITGTAIFYYDLTIMNRVARLLHKYEDTAYYQQLATQVKKAFNERFFNRQQMQYDTASQTANAMALYMDLVEPANRNAVTEALIRDIRNRNNALTAGDIGYRYVLRALEAAKRNDVVFDMNSRSDVPGYGFQLAHGATALTESWQAYPSVSNNHFMLGHLMEWFYSALAGIKQAGNGVAWSAIIIEPEPVGDVTAAKAGFQSPYGLIESDWKKQDDHFELTVTIPANTKATIHLPAKPSSVIKENERTISNIRYKNGKAIIQTGSGRYHFIVQPK